MIFLLQDKLFNARETSETVVKEKAQKNKDQIVELLSMSQNMIHTFKNLSEIVTDFAEMAKAFKVPNILTSDILEVSHATSDALYLYQLKSVSVSVSVRNGTENPFCTVDHIDVNGTERIFCTVGHIRSTFNGAERIFCTVPN